MDAVKDQIQSASKINKEASLLVKMEWTQEVNEEPVTLCGGILYKQLHQYGNVHSQEEKAMDNYYLSFGKGCVCILHVNSSSQADLLQGPPQEQNFKRGSLS